jgi:oleate hydratase
VYLIGSGIASLASAVYLEKDAGVPGENIHILEKDNIAGGALDGIGDTEKGFVVRGGRMHEMHYECYWEWLLETRARFATTLNYKNGIRLQLR